MQDVFYFAILKNIAETSAHQIAAMIFQQQLIV
jgi:hypothetical protein